MVEQIPCKDEVVGSIPIVGSRIMWHPPTKNITPIDFDNGVIELGYATRSGQTAGTAPLMIKIITISSNSDWIVLHKEYSKFQIINILKDKRLIPTSILNLAK